MNTFTPRKTSLSTPRASAPSKTSPTNAGISKHSSSRHSLQPARPSTDALTSVTRSKIFTKSQLVKIYHEKEQNAFSLIGRVLRYSNSDRRNDHEDIVHSIKLMENISDDLMTAAASRESVDKMFDSAADRSRGHFARTGYIRDLSAYIRNRVRSTVMHGRVSYISLSKQEAHEVLIAVGKNSETGDFLYNRVSGKITRHEHIRKSFLYCDSLVNDVWSMMRRDDKSRDAIFTSKVPQLITYATAFNVSKRAIFAAVDELEELTVRYARNQYTRVADSRRYQDDIRDSFNRISNVFMAPISAEYRSLY